eukprot:TRINITY_DN32102_c0_g1_i1.p1 TRINITY_DN32102_c0_g1~~TRINITY_DN32102_c0_g1_i1.p1  ORF type:complete len:148 (+),score=8.77 TRINITY_DN32102_c0_g1_i1:235-678(+)
MVAARPEGKSMRIRIVILVALLCLQAWCESFRNFGSFQGENAEVIVWLRQDKPRNQGRLYLKHGADGTMFQLPKSGWAGLLKACKSRGSATLSDGVQLLRVESDPTLLRLTMVKVVGGNPVQPLRLELRAYQREQFLAALQAVLAEL